MILNYKTQYLIYGNSMKFKLQAVMIGPCDYGLLTGR